MNEYCTDRDLLGIEPIVFLGGGFPCQELAGGQGGQLSGTTFQAAAGGFVSAGIKAGMVLCTYKTTPAEGSAWEIVGVLSPTQLSVSVLRADVGGPVTPPKVGSDLLYHVRTYACQFANVSAALGEKLRQISEVAGVAPADYARSVQLRLAAAYGALTEIFVARADNAEAYDANWLKAQHYRQLSREAQMRLRLVSDDDGDGRAERTRSLGNVTLKRS